jgi:hypothetical protein
MLGIKDRPGQQCASHRKLHSIHGMHHGQAISEIVNDEPNNLERFKDALRLP